MTWNHRIIATTDPDGEIYFEIAEVHYDDAGKPYGYGQGIAIGGDSINAIKEDFRLQRQALKRPILWGKDRFPEEYKNIES